MNTIRELRGYIESDDFVEELAERMSEHGHLKSQEELEDRLFATENRLAQTTRELKQALKLIAALAEGKQLKVIRHPGGTTFKLVTPPASTGSDITTDQSTSRESGSRCPSSAGFQ